MAVSLGDVFLYLRGDDKHLKSDLSKAERETKSWASELGGTLKTAFAVALGGLLERGFMGLAGGIAVAARSGFQFNDSMEQARTRINAFTKDGEATERILDMIRIRAAETPFAFDEMATAAAGLLPAAKQSGAALEDLIAQAEILAASNPAEGLEGAAFALKEAVSGDFTSIIERFNLPRTYINQLKEEGVPALEIVSRAMEELGLDADLVAGLAETAQGRWSTFMDTLQNLAGLITQPLFDAWSAGLGQANEMLSIYTPTLNSLAELIGGKLSEGVTWVTGLFGDLTSQVGYAISVIQPWVTWLQENLAAALAFVNQHWEEFKGALIGIGAVLAAGAILGGIITITGAIMALVNPITAIIAVAALLGAAWAGNWGGIQEKTQAVIDFLMPYINTFLETIKTWWEENGQSILATVNGLWGNIQLWAMAAIEFLKPYVLGFLESVQGWWDEHGAGVMGIVQGLWNFIQGIVTTLVGFWNDNHVEILNIARANWNTLATIVRTVVAQIGNVIDLFAALLRGDWERVGQELREIWSTAWNATVTILSNARTALVNGVTILWGMVSPLWDSLVESIRHNWNALWNGVVTFFETKKQAIVEKVLGIKNTLTNQWQSMVTWVSDKWNGLWSEVVTFFETKKNDLVSKILTLKNQVANFFTLDNFVQLGHNIIDGIIRGIFDKSSQLYNSLRQLAADALTAAKYNLGIRSPSSLFAEQVGAPISEGIAQGILASIGDVQSAIAAAVTPPQMATAGAGASNTRYDQRSYTINYSGREPVSGQMDLSTLRALK